MEDLYALLAILIGLPLAFAVAKFTDPYWRIRFMRQRFNKDYHMAIIISKDRKELKPKIFLPEDSMLWNNGMCWTVISNHIYRKDKPEEAFDIKKEHIKWEGTGTSGIPCIFIDEDSFRPIDFDYNMPTNAKPGEAGAILKSWVVNQLAKALATMKRQETYMIIAILLALVAAGVSYWNHMTLEDMSKQLSSVENNTIIVRDFLVPRAITGVANVTGGTVTVGR